MSNGKATYGTIGVGAVGTVLAAALAKSGARVIVTDLPARLAQVKQNGLQVRGLDMDDDQEVVPVDSIRAMAAENPECVLIATKAYVLKELMPELAEASSRRCLIISAENGIGTEDEIAEHIPARDAARMVVNYAGHIDDAGIARLIWFNPPNYFGALEDQPVPCLDGTVARLNAAGLTSEVISPLEIKKRAFLKTILTSALMPICAVMKLTMKEAMAGTATRQLAGDLLHEGLSVAARLGYDYGPDIWEKCMGYLEKGGNHHPSMSVDLWKKHPTEIDYINAKILEIGQHFPGLDLEVNRVMTCLLMTCEAQNGTRPAECFPDCLTGCKKG